MKKDQDQAIEIPRLRDRGTGDNTAYQAGKISDVGGGLASATARDCTAAYRFLAPSTDEAPV